MPHKPIGGFTLLEMLVTLVLFSFLSSLIWQGMAWMAGVERSMAVTQTFSTRESLRQEWVRQLFRGIVSGLFMGPDSFKGTKTGFTCLTSTPPWPGLAGPLEIQVALGQQDERTDVTVQTAGRDPVQLWSFKGEGILDYLDESGRWHNAWPPEDMGGEVRPGRIPRAIRLRGTPLVPLLVAVWAKENVSISRTQLPDL